MPTPVEKRIVKETTFVSAAVHTKTQAHTLFHSHELTQTHKGTAVWQRDVELGDIDTTAGELMWFDGIYEKLLSGLFILCCRKCWCVRLHRMSVYTTCRHTRHSQQQRCCEKTATFEKQVRSIESFIIRMWKQNGSSCWAQPLVALHDV